MDRSMNKKQKELVDKMYRGYTNIILMASSGLHCLQQVEMDLDFRDVKDDPCMAKELAAACRVHKDYMGMLFDNVVSNPAMATLWDELIDSFEKGEA